MPIVMTPISYINCPSLWIQTHFCRRILVVNVKVIVEPEKLPFCNFP